MSGVSFRSTREINIGCFRSNGERKRRQSEMSGPKIPIETNYVLCHPDSLRAESKSSVQQLGNISNLQAAM